jgi:hypothetical protein
MDTYGEYLILRSASSAFASVTNKLTDQVNDKLEEGWIPNGAPKILFVSEKYIMIQSMVR